MRKAGLFAVQRLGIAALTGSLMVSVSYARTVEFSNGVPETITVKATIESLAYISPELCEEDPERMGCEYLVPVEQEPKHYCETHPNATGCKYYQIEPSTGTKYE